MKKKSHKRISKNLKKTQSPILNIAQLKKKDRFPKRLVVSEKDKKTFRAGISQEHYRLKAIFNDYLLRSPQEMLISLLDLHKRLFK